MGELRLAKNREESELEIRNRRRGSKEKPLERANGVQHTRRGLKYNTVPDIQKYIYFVYILYTYEIFMYLEVCMYKLNSYVQYIESIASIYILNI